MIKFYLPLLLALFLAACGGDSSENASKDSDADGVIDSQDAFPFDKSETTDTDKDGVGDNSDAFIHLAAVSVDADNDGLPDAWHDDCDDTCQVDSGLTLDSSLDDFDNDGVKTADDDFPVQVAASVDADNDGLPDAWRSSCDNACQLASGLILDSHLDDFDNDGVTDAEDAFPEDSRLSKFTVSGKLTGMTGGVTIHLNGQSRTLDDTYSFYFKVAKNEQFSFTFDGYRPDRVCSTAAMRYTATENLEDMVVAMTCRRKTTTEAIAEITDSNFATCLTGRLRQQYADEVTSISCISKSISSAKGISSFTALTSLELLRNKLTEFDVSNNTALTTLYLNQNKFIHAPLGLQTITSTSATIKLTDNPFDNNAKATLEALKETYKNLTY